MTRGHSRSGRLRAKTLRVVAVTLLLVVSPLVIGIARADNIDDLIEKLDDSSERVRLTAVLTLTNQNAPKALAPLAKTMLKKSEAKNVRGLAANAIGKTLLNGKPSAAQRKAAIEALTTAKGDPEPFVSAKAQAALDSLGSGGGGTPTTPQPGTIKGVYVNIGPMAVNAPGADKAKNRALMEKKAKDALSKYPNYKQTWPGGLPTQQQLTSKGVAGFYVDGTLNELKVNGGKVSCKVSMLFADFPNKAVIGTLTGNANVDTGYANPKPQDIALAQTDCVEAVAEDLIVKKIVPTIKSQTGIP